MTELEEAVGLLSQLVNVSLKSSLVQEPEPTQEIVLDEPAIPIGQYL